MTGNLIRVIRREPAGRALCSPGCEARGSAALLCYTAALNPVQAGTAVKGEERRRGVEWIQCATVTVLSRFRWALLQLIRYIVDIVTRGRERRKAMQRPRLKPTKAKTKAS